MMKKTAKQNRARVLACCVLFALAVFAALILPPAAKAGESFVTDDAGLFTAEEAAALSNKCRDYGYELNYTLLIATTNDTNGKQTSLYAGDFFEEHSTEGYGGGQDGMVFLIDMQHREVFISTHGAAHSLFADEDIDYILDKMMPYLSSGDYAKAANVFLDKARYSVDQLEQGYIPARGQAAPSTAWVIGRAFLIAFGCGAIAVSIMYAVHRASLSKAPGGQKYMAAGGVHITRQVDRFLTTHTAVIPKPKHDNNNNGGFGGGSSGGGRTTTTFSSSSGGSFGGGGRKF